MLKFVILLAFVATVNSVLSDPSDCNSQGKSAYSQAYASASASSSSSSSATATSSASSSSTFNNKARCKHNEEFLSCPNENCKARICDELGFPLSCFQINNNSTDCGRPGCYCKDGFVKNNNGLCIPQRDCPSCGGDLNAWAGYGAFCTTCDNYKNKNRPCPLILILNGCDCRPNYVYDTRRNKCVLPEQCLNTYHCGENEVYDVCPSTCPPRTCETKDRFYKCEAALQPGDPKCLPPVCRCDNDYYRNNQGKCVLKEQCPPNCGLNEVVSDCANSPCIKNCATKDQNYQCKPYPPGCKPGCVCADGYFRNDNGTCVRENECKRSCGENEVFSSCKNRGCDKRNCTQRLEPALCIDLIDEACISGCVCQEGFLRTAGGKCVPENECPSSEVCPKPREYFDLCPASCPGRKCGTDDRLVFCVEQPKVGDANCSEPSCRCEEGFYRSPNGDCVTFEECPTCKGQFEEYSNCANGGCDQRNCTQLGRPQICINLIDGTCEHGCVCQKGYLRNAQGVCVPVDQCPKNEVCSKPHEYFDQCPASCPARQCGKDDRLVRCIPPLNPGDPNCAPPACRCESGYFRNSYGNCVTFEECPPTCGENEVPFDCVNSPCLRNNCAQKDLKIMCRRKPTNCKAGCICADGYLRANNGTCVPKDQCPSTPICKGQFEEYSNCANGGCDQRNCTQLGRPQICKNLIDGACEGGCVCQKGYLRNAKGVCVPVDQCPKNEVCSKPHEYYDQCPASCPARQCGKDDRLVRCKDPLNPGDPKCAPPACRCESGYYRNSYGDCVTFEECSISCGQNEIYYPCPKPICANQTCENIGKIYDCPLIPLNYTCKGECRCQPGFYKNKIGQCITEEECTPTCGKNEVPFDCVNGPCLRNNCTQKDLKTVCRRKPANCKAGCICADGYLRANNGTCIPRDQCPSTPPTCGENEVPFDCVNSPCLRNNCAQKDLKTVCRRKPANCTAGCICADGYLRANNGTCIPRDQCPSTPICKGQFEEYSNCANGGCDQRNCTQLGRPQICINLVDGSCEGGCVCQKGYLRNAKGVCVPVDQCPKNEVCSKPHEYYDQCPASCPARQCGIDDSIVRCKEPLNPGDPKCAPPACRCESGYYRNVYGDCVTLEECSISCGQNEIYYPCPKPICANQTCENIGKIYNCPFIPLNYTCKGECRCQPGFYKNKIGQCITEEECKKCTGDYEYFSCGGACDNECEKLKYQSQKNCSIINIVCNPMCYCFEDYARDRNNTCIPISQCPPGCDNENEEYIEGPNKICRPKTCDDLGFPFSCYPSDLKNTESVKPGCICKSGLVRDKNGVCILESECQTSETIITPTTGSTSTAVAEEQFNLGSIVFNADFFNVVVQNNIGKSLIVSPYSTLVLLTQCALYAKGLTLEQLLKAFNFDSTDKIRAAIPGILDSINNQRNVTLSLVDKVYGNKRSSFSDAFKRDTEVIYKAEAENIDMTNGQAAADYMNKWVASQTNNKILDLIPGSLITPNTELVLVNAIYCLAEWRYKFNEINTQPDEFYISEDKNVKVDMMNQVIYINYTENNEYDAKAIELPYVNSNLTCLIILPNNKDGAPALVSKLANQNAIKSIRESFTYERVSVSIPKFNSTTTIDLKDVLQKLNIKELFNPDSDGLSGILADPSVNIFVTAGIQKANIIINESGSEASAANAIIGVRSTSVPQTPPKLFKANYSFIYFILFRGVPFFSGMFTGQ